MSTSAAASQLSTHFTTIEVHSSDAGPLEPALAGLDSQQPGSLADRSAGRIATEDPQRTLARIPNFDSASNVEPPPPSSVDSTVAEPVPIDSATADSETADSETLASPLPKTAGPSQTKPRFNQSAWRLSQIPPKWTLAIVVALVVVLSAIIFSSKNGDSPPGSQESGSNFPAKLDTAELWNGSNGTSNEEPTIPLSTYNTPITGTAADGDRMTNRSAADYRPHSTTGSSTSVPNFNTSSARKIEQIRASVAAPAKRGRYLLPKDRGAEIARRLPTSDNRSSYDSQDDYNSSDRGATDLPVDQSRRGWSSIPSMRRNRFADQAEDNRELGNPTRSQSHDGHRHIRRSDDDRHIGDRRARSSGARFDGTIQ